MTVAARPTKMQSVRARLTELAHDLGPGAKLPTVVQLRDRLGVSVATLNTALGDLEGQGVLNRRHGVGIYVSPRLLHRSIALVCDPSFFQSVGASPFWGSLVEHARARAAAHDEAFTLHFAQPSPLVPVFAQTAVAPGDAGGLSGGAEWSRPAAPPVALGESLAADIAGGRLDGVIGIGLGLDIARWIESQPARTPLTTFAGPSRRIVVVDSAALVRMAVEQLAAQGCKRIALWSPIAPARPNNAAPSSWSESSGRIAFRETLARCGLPFDPALVRENIERAQSAWDAGKAVVSETHQQQGYKTALAVFASAENAPGGVAAPPDGVVITDDMMTLGALAALQNQGIAPGRDVRIASHANIGSPALLGRESDLTLIEFDSSEVVVALFDLLEAAMLRGDSYAPFDDRSDSILTPEVVVSLQPRLRNE